MLRSKRTCVAGHHETAATTIATANSGQRPAMSRWTNRWVGVI